MSRKQQLRFLSFIVLILKILNADFTGRIAAAAAAAPARRVAFKLRAKKKVHQKLRNPQITAGNLGKAQRGPGRCVQNIGLHLKQRIYIRRTSAAPRRL